MAVTLDWLGCATFRLTINDLVVFLDAYIDRVPGAVPVGITVEQIQRADWIVVGHSHFDHLYGAERIAKATGATIIGSYETVRVMETQGVPLAQLLPVAGGETIRLAKDVTVSVFPSQHSCVWSHKEMPQSDHVCIGDLGVTYQEQQERIKNLWTYLESLGGEAMTHLQVSAQGARGDGGALLYLFETPEGSLLFQDTSGHWSGILKNLRPDVAILAAAGRGNIDGEPVQGSLAHFVARQADLIRPRRVILSHHDNWLPGFSSATKVAPIRSELERWVPRTELLEVGYLTRVPIFQGVR
ncbi:MAG: MBL fold metallo-hydrolase [Deltaproteobacteria bacterium]|nr:MBL fold metallo-hydrolase [Deltaproteobacteria bacterium]